MFEILKHKKWRISLISVLLLVLTLFSLFFVYRIISRKVINGEVAKISIEKADKYYDYEMSEQKKKELNENLSDFVYLIYESDLNNSSDKIKVSDINIQPIFSISMKPNVYWYAGTNVITDSEMSINPGQTKNYGRRILIKRNGFTDNELINMAEKDKFKITYYTLEGTSIFSFGYNSQTIGFKEK